VGHDVVDEPDPQGLVGGQEVPGDRQFDRAADADGLREEDRDPSPRHHTDSTVRVCEARGFGRDEEGALERDLEAAGDCRAIDRPDDRLVDEREESVQAVRVAWRERCDTGGARRLA
jgi:hypothetical protein